MKIITPRKLNGFTMIEVIVAVGIFVLTILGIVTFFAYASQFNRLSKNTTIASNLAQQVADENIEKTYDQLMVGPGEKTVFSTDLANPYYPFKKQTDIYFIDRNLNIVGNNTGLKKIVCTIYWNEGTIEKNVQIATIKNQN